MSTGEMKPREARIESLFPVLPPCAATELDLDRRGAEARRPRAAGTRDGDHKPARGHQTPYIHASYPV
jgi:hypothetical protein